MKVSNSNNPRYAGSIGFDFYTVLGFIILGFFAASVVTIQLGCWIIAEMGNGEPVHPNPFATTGELLAGKRTWTASATVFSIVFWLVTAVLVVVGWRLVKKLRKPKTRVDTVAKYLASKEEIHSFSEEKAHQLAVRWLPTKDMAAAYPGIRFGKIPGTSTGLYSSWEDLFLVIFGPRLGKTTSQVIPAIVEAPGNVITTSNKRDVVDDTIKITSARGQVWVFDPQRIAPGFEQQPWFFDPLDMIRRSPEAMDSEALRLAEIFKCAARGEDSGGDAYFSEGGKDLLARFFLAAALESRPIGDVFLWVNDDSDRTPLKILRKYPEWAQQAAALQGTYNITEKTRSGLFSQAAQMATILGRREALKWVTPTAGHRRFCAEDFVRARQNTVYLLSKEGADNAAALTTALTAAITTAAETYGETCGGRLPVPLVAALDEAANTVRWPELPSLYSHFGSRGIILMTILQSYAQGAAVWGEKGMELLWSATSILLYGGGVRDEKMLQKLESLIGEVEIFETSTSRTGEGPRNVSRQRREKKILTVAELASLEQGRALVLATKRRPMIAQLEPWWERPWTQEVKALLPSPK
ncbi:type IV secretory system conjugative DNA transfer family protein [Corynebacterium ulcerans]|uniref:type IV secretory system conjugative DNA transfer family protein n=1 Tax=Corynebacterium ulcerans TaxID=65058 RepID=UPI003D700230